MHRGLEKLGNIGPSLLAASQRVPFLLLPYGSHLCGVGLFMESLPSFQAARRSLFFARAISRADEWEDGKVATGEVYAKWIDGADKSREKNRMNAWLNVTPASQETLKRA